MPNIHPDNGIPYGLIAADDLDPEIVHQLMFGPQATNESYEDALGQFLFEARLVLEIADDEDLEDEDDLTQKFNDTWEDYEPTITGTLEGVTYATCWIGGALNFWILESPVQALGAPGSPCVPGACVLKPGYSGGWYVGYSVPEGWWFVTEEV